MTGLQEVVFNNNFFPDYSSFRLIDSCARSLPRKIEDLVTSWISPDHPLTNFSYDFLAENRSLYADKLQKRSREDFPVHLSDLADITQIAVQIVGAFVTLPWEYTVVLPFASTAGVDLRLKELPFSGDLCLKRYSELRFPIPEVPESPLARLFHVDLPKDMLYFEATLEGYIGLGVATETLERFYHQVRSVAGIGLAVKALRLSPPRYPLAMPFEPLPKKSLVVYRMGRSNEATPRTVYVPDRIGPLDRLELHPVRFNSIHLLPIAFGEEDECIRLQEAGQWYFASATEGNEIFEFVEAVVVLEVLFNEQATAVDVGIQKLIANRCAYLTAESTSERQDIIKKVNAIYDARSKIVHRGKARLNKEEKRLLIEASVLGSVSIFKELSLILRSRQQRNADLSG